MISITEASVGEKEYLVYLSLERTDRFRYYHNLERGKITRFRVQYEALIGGEWRAIVRYDTAHGRPHKDLLHPDGTQDKHEFYGYAREEVLTWANATSKPTGNAIAPLTNRRWDDDIQPGNNCRKEHHVVF
jgi:hypothetical protein